MPGHAHELPKEFFLRVNRPVATDVRDVKGPSRRVRLNAWLGRT
jgi:hypothetical protein